MKETSIKVHDSISAKKAVINIQNLKIENGPYSVTIEEYKDNRSLSQNRLYWLWIKELCNEYGWDRKDIILHMKEHFLIPLLLEFDKETRETASALKELRLHKRLKDQYEILRKVFIRESSTTKLNTKQFKEYLDRIDKWALSEHGCRLPVPDDLANK